MDFTLTTYINLLKALTDQGFSFLPFCEYRNYDVKRTIILRHDVDLLPKNSLEFAKIQAKEGIRGSYYFRFVPESYDEVIIKEISALGHEIGYHYETMDTCKGDVDRAYNLFCESLDKLRKIVPVSTICMHGSPLSKYDNRLIWHKYDYRKLGIIGEPYFDLDFDEVFYLTDTGRRWDGGGVSVRDKIMGEGERGREGEGENENPFDNWKVKPVKYRSEGLRDGETKRLRDLEKRGLGVEVTEKEQLSTSNEQYSFAKAMEWNASNEQPATSNQQQVTFPKFHSTSDIITALNTGIFPERAMITMHPQRWTDKPLPWARELVWQNLKNTVKYFVVKGCV